MTFQPVPWFVGGGAENPPEAARLLAHIATRGAAGVLLPDDCAVLEAAVPSGNVRVSSGSVVIPNGKSNADGEVYLGRNPDDHTVAITPTGAGAGRSDLVYVRVSDPQYGDEPAPADVAGGPYITVEVAAGVAPTTRTVAEAIAQGVLPVGRVGLALARVDMPASTGTVTQGLVEDVRPMPAPRAYRTQRLGLPAGGESLTSSGFVVFPSTSSWALEVPEWATHAIITGQIIGPRFGANVKGEFRVALGSVKGTGCPYDLEAASTKDRANLLAAGEVKIPKSMRGTTQNVRLEGRRISGTGSLSSGPWITTSADIEFVERIR